MKPGVELNCEGKKRIIHLGPNNHRCGIRPRAYHQAKDAGKRRNVTERSAEASVSTHFRAAEGFPADVAQRLGAKKGLWRALDHVGGQKLGSRYLCTPH